jgi:hypothetical protein
LLDSGLIGPAQGYWTYQRPCTSIAGPPLGAPNGVLGAPGFGSITSAGDPRVVQLGLKQIF